MQTSPVATPCSLRMLPTLASRRWSVYFGLCPDFMGLLTTARGLCVDRAVEKIMATRAWRAKTFPIDVRFTHHQEGRHFAVLVCTLTKFGEGRSMFSRSTENGPAFP